MFGAHKDKIIGRSEFFARALNGSWKESDDNLVNLPEDKPHVFELYLQLLYKNVVPVRNAISLYAENHKSNDTVSGDVQDADISEQSTDAEQGKTKKSAEALTQEVWDNAILEWNALIPLYILCEKLQDR
ncbi:hypothetical protein BU26DRAFT_166598 [Trematosphaeria pertusa]|uniref:BTB domain-containing protein n=1 Tax=Trematosphaeria pertusa TaxID=390896 RepID=A0A6A6HXM9_9PLEO|nr:uncharacterized protein BU26DRAFT_166598 [Trematosphaeria pertusa]KAF2242120.1 hypothetical protein BU26DRAFT_166598 [Trematosphaeria pertusa]